MPKGKYNNTQRRARYAILREAGAPDRIAVRVRDWKSSHYFGFLECIRKYGLEYTIKQVFP